MKTRAVVCTSMAAILGISAAPLYAAERQATCADVNSVVAQAVDGDTITINGPCTITAPIAIARGITLDGGGNTSMTSDITLTPNTTASARITGFLFDGNTSRITVGSQAAILAADVKPFRIDHNHWGTDSLSGPSGVDIEIWGRAGITALIDHNTIFAGTAGRGALSSYGPEPIHVFGGANRAYIWNDNSQDQAGWHASITPGSPHAVYLEDNTFTELVSSVSGCSFVEAYSGSSIVVRNNTIKNCAFDEHGTRTAVGARWWELYDNTYYTTFCAFYSDIRAGSGVIFGNTRAPGSTAGKGFQIREEDTTDAYPACYQIGRGYDPATGESCKRDNPSVWGCSGSGCANPETSSPVYIWGNDSDMQAHINVTQGSSLIQLGRDYFVSVAKPQSLLRCQSADDVAAGCPVTYDYEPFTYPYPLDANGMPNPLPAGTRRSKPPENLRVK